MPAAHDVDGPTADARLEDQRERAEARYELVIHRAPVDDAGWRTLRRALRLSRADRPWLEARTPGPVRRGARADLVPLLARLEQSGHAASIRERDGDG